MGQIALIAPSEAIAERARNALAAFGPDAVSIHIGMMREGVQIARELMEKEHPRVLISRGGTALLLREQLRLNVVEIKISLPDAAAALSEARKYGDKILFLGFSNHIDGVASLAAVTGLDIREMVLAQWQDADNAIADARRDGFDVVVGGAVQQRAALEAGMPFVFLQTGENAILDAYREALAIVEALRIEERKTQEIRTILDFSRDGFIAIDNEARVTLVNKSAATMIGAKAEAIVGNVLPEAAPPIAGLADALTGSQPKDDIVTLGKTTVLCQQLTMKHDGRVVGAMATLRSVDAVQSDENRIRIRQYQDGLFANYRFSDIIGDSEAVADAKKQAADFAKVDATVLIESESGTGKEMFSQSIHNASGRRSGPFVGINCASLSISILESELFGYVDGAFTGARKGGKAGVFELANNGTIFLDEIGELPLPIQGKLLRVLQERCVMRLGATRIVPVNVRVVAATNLNLVEQVRKGRFRKDLFFRLDVLRLSIPPLRQRQEDIPGLSALFLKKHGGKRFCGLTPRQIKTLQKYSWPGNIRELENLMERLTLFNESEYDQIIARHFENMEPLAESGEVVVDAKAARAALREAGGSKKKAADLLGIHRSTLYRLLKMQ